MAKRQIQKKLKVKSKHKEKNEVVRKAQLAKKIRAVQYV